MELRPISPSVSPDVPDGGVNNVTAGCSALVLQIGCAFASKCTRVHTTSARLQSMLGTTTGFLANSVSHRTRNKFVGCVSCTPLAISSCVLCMRKRERCCKKCQKLWVWLTYRWARGLRECVESPIHIRQSLELATQVVTLNSFFFPSSISIWNKLSYDVVLCPHPSLLLE